MKNQTALQKANEKWFDEDKWFNEPDNQEDLRKNYCLLLLTDLRYGEIFKLFNTNFQKFYENALKLDFGTPNDEGWAPNVICPFHDERNPSFAVNLKTGTFRCFGCNQRGTAIQFYQRKHQVGYRKAIEDLGDLSGFDWDPRKLQQKL